MRWLKMKILQTVKCDGKVYKAGSDYKGGLPEDVENRLKERGGYFEVTVSKDEDVNLDDLNVQAIQRLSLPKLSIAIKRLTNDELIELHELETNSTNRTGAISVIDEALTD